MSQETKEVVKTTSTNADVQMYTMKDAMEQIKSSELAKREAEQKRLREFIAGFKVLQAQTGCSFQIDGSSPLNNLQIIPVPSRG